MLEQGLFNANLSDRYHHEQAIANLSESLFTIGG
jgi:hypothetical protein